jgi:hypothetical protein
MTTRSIIFNELPLIQREYLVRLSINQCDGPAES